MPTCSDTSNALSDADRKRVEIVELLRKNGIGCTVSWEASKEQKGRKRIVAVAMFGVEGVEPWPMAPELADPILQQLEDQVWSSMSRGQSRAG